MNQTITLTPVILDAIEIVRTQTIAAVTTAKLADGLAISLRQNINKVIDKAIDSVCLPLAVTLPPTDNGDYPSA
jgi:hypothetical protein